MNSLASQNQSFCSNGSIESQVSVVRRPVAPSYPSIDSVLKASIPSPTTPPDSTWTLESASNSTVDLDQPSPTHPEHPEPTLQERPISYLAPLPNFPIVKRYRHVRFPSSRLFSVVNTFTLPISSHFLPASSSMCLFEKKKTR